MITDRFVFIHIPKTGGTTIRNLIASKCKVFSNDIHLTLRQSMEKTGKWLPSFCFVRNPWDWYVSRFFYRRKILREGGRDGFINLELTGDGKEGFHKHMTLLNNLYEKGKHVIDSPCRAMRLLSIQDFYNHFTFPDVTYIGHFENFASDLAQILKTLAPDAKFLFQTRLNESEHLPYQEYYSDEIIDMVDCWDAAYIEQFGYRFGE